MSRACIAIDIDTSDDMRAESLAQVIRALISSLVVHNPGVTVIDPGETA